MKPVQVRILVVGILLVAQPGLARALLERFTVDPERSGVELGGEGQVSLVFGFGTLLDSIDLSIQSQEAIGGVGGTLPDGTRSDGLRTNLEGTLVADVTPFSIELIDRRTRIFMGDSGNWLPGAPSDRGTATPGELAVTSATPDPPFDLNVTGTLRGVEMSLRGSSTGFIPAGNGTFQFFLGFQTLVPTIVDGALDYDTTIPGVSGRAALMLGPTAILNQEMQGTLEVRENGGRRITIPFRTDLVLTDDDFGIGVPWVVTLPVSGQIVAVNDVFLVPEPELPFLVPPGLVLLGWLARRRRGLGKDGR